MLRIYFACTFIMVSTLDTLLVGGLFLGLMMGMGCVFRGFSRCLIVRVLAIHVEHVIVKFGEEIADRT